MKIGKVRASSAPRAAGRPPSPAPGHILIGDHRFAGGAGSLEQRLAAVEAQQAADHAYFGELTAAVRGLVATGELLKKDQATLRSETPDYAGFDFQVRKELAALRGEIDGDLTRTVTIFEGKVQELHDAITKIQIVLTNMSAQEGQMAEYLGSLHDVRPKEGRALTSPPST